MNWSIPGSMSELITAMEAKHDCHSIEIRDDDDGDACPLSFFEYNCWAGEVSRSVIRPCTPDEVLAVAVQTAKDLHAQREKERPAREIGETILRHTRGAR